MRCLMRTLLSPAAALLAPRLRVRVRVGAACRAVWGEVEREDGACEAQ